MRWVAWGLSAWMIGCSSANDAGAGVGDDAGAGVEGGVGGGTWGDAAAGDADASQPQGDPCSVDGREGTCLNVADCTAPGYAAVMGFCPGPAEIQCCAPLPTGGTCDPDAYPLPNAGLTEPPGVGGCPSGMLPVDTFCIDAYEAFLVTYPDGAPVSPYFNPGSTPVMARSAPGAVPQGYIDQVRASAACTNAGKRLCTNSEWLRACGGPTATTFPYGAMLQVGLCNDHRAEHPAIEYFMTTDSWIWSELGHPCLNQLADGLAEAGSFSSCKSAEGAFDMMGNLHEWTSDPAGTFRGGFYVDTVQNGPGCEYVTTAHDVNHWDYSTGFRCCAD